MTDLPGNVTLINLPEFCPIALGAMAGFGDNQELFVNWLDEHSKTCEACKQLIELLTAVLSGEPPPQSETS